MTCGIKKPNKLIRIIIGVAIIVIGLYFDSYLALIGLIPIAFAISGYCPLCAIKAYKRND